tara:strand:+ start:1268 stop:1819 length:552 start_codon:yes stop_codon:yes gene_type:complete
MDNNNNNNNSSINQTLSDSESFSREVDISLNSLFNFSNIINIYNADNFNLDRNSNLEMSVSARNFQLLANLINPNRQVSYADVLENSFLENEVRRRDDNIELDSDKVKKIWNRNMQEKFENCSICMSEYTPGDIISVTCNNSHCFHYECLNTWCKREPKCPLCKQDLPYKIIDDENPYKKQRN